MTREVSRENSQDALDKDPRAVRPDQPEHRFVPQHFVFQMDGREVLRINPDGTLTFADATEAAKALHAAWLNLRGEA